MTLEKEFDLPVVLFLSPHTQISPFSLYIFQSIKCLVLHIVCGSILKLCIYTTTLIHNLYEHANLHFLLFEVRGSNSYRSRFCPKDIFHRSHFKNE